MGFNKRIWSLIAMGTQSFHVLWKGMLDVALSTDFMETPIYFSFFDFCLAGSAYAYLDENLANFFTA